VTFLVHQDPLLLASVGVGLLLPLVPFLPGLPLRLLLGLPALLWAPGYAFLAFLGASGLTPLERAGLALGLSMVVSGLVALLLGLSPLGFHSLGITGGVALWVVGFGVQALRRGSSSPSWGLRPSRSALVMGGAFLLTVGVAMAFPAVRNGPFRPPTAFYLVDAGDAEQPLQVWGKGPFTYRLAIVSGEREPTTFRVRVEVDGVPVERLGPVRLAPGERWEGTVRLERLEGVGPWRVEFLLFRGPEEGPPYRWLALVLRP